MVSFICAYLNLDQDSWENTSFIFIKDVNQQWSKKFLKNLEILGSTEIFFNFYVVYLQILSIFWILRIENLYFFIRFFIYIIILYVYDLYTKANFSALMSVRWMTQLPTMKRIRMLTKVHMCVCIKYMCESKSSYAIYFLF